MSSSDLKAESDEPPSALCVVCMEPYDTVTANRQPRLLSCGHTFCTECVGRLVVSQKCVTCPNCRQPTPFQSASALKVNFALVELIQLTNPSAAPSSESSVVVDRPVAVPCRNCDVHMALLYCANCDLELCTECSGNVHANKAFSKHQVVELARKAVVAGPPSCEIHKRRSKELFCQDCGVAICEGCRISTHSTHSFAFIADLAADERRRLTAATKQCNELVPKIKHRLDQLKLALELCEQSAHEQQLLVQAMMDQLQQAVQSRQRELIAEVEYEKQRQNAFIKAELARTELVHLLIVTDQERCRGASASDGCLADFQVVGQAAKVEEDVRQVALDLEDYQLVDSPISEILNSLTNRPAAFVPMTVSNPALDSIIAWIQDLGLRIDSDEDSFTDESFERKHSTAKWSSDHKSNSVLIENAGSVATKKEGGWTYVQCSDFVYSGIRTWKIKILEKPPGELVFIGIAAPGIQPAIDGTTYADPSSYGIWSDGDVRAAGLKVTTSHEFPPASILRADLDRAREWNDRMFSAGDEVSVTVDCSAFTVRLQSPTMDHLLHLKRGHKQQNWVLTVNFGYVIHQLQLLE